MLFAILFIAIGIIGLIVDHDFRKTNSLYYGAGLLVIDLAFIIGGVMMLMNPYRGTNPIGE